jgi:LytTR family transcriptional regulator, CO-responsive transcriptional regulator RcoM
MTDESVKSTDSEMKIGLIFLSGDWQIVGMNDHVLRMAGSVKEIMGKQLLDFHPQQVRGKVQALLSQISAPQDGMSNSVVLDMFDKVFLFNMSRLTFFTQNSSAEWAVSVIDITEPTGAALNPQSGQVELDKFPIYENGIFHFLAAKQIYAIEADGNYCRIYTAERKHYLLMSLKSVLQKFTSADLFRVHKSFIVNIKHISTIDLHEGNRMTISFDEPTIPPVPVSRRRAADLKKIIS